MQFAITKMVYSLKNGLKHKKRLYNILRSGIETYHESAYNAKICHKMKNIINNRVFHLKRSRESYTMSRNVFIKDSFYEAAAGGRPHAGMIKE